MLCSCSVFRSIRGLLIQIAHLKAGSLLVKKTRLSKMQEIVGSIFMNLKYRIVKLILMNLKDLHKFGTVP